MEVTGTLKLINDTQTFGSSGFRKRELVLTTDETYPQMIQIEFVQDKCDLLNPFQVGQKVKISINLRGKEWLNPQGEAKYFNTIQGWRIEKLDSQNVNDIPVKGAEEISPDNDDQLPF